LTSTSFFLVSGNKLLREESKEGKGRRRGGCNKGIIPCQRNQNA
jgi:hypothetical protein